MKKRSAVCRGKEKQGDRQGSRRAQEVLREVEARLPGGSRRVAVVCELSRVAEPGSDTGPD